MTMATLCPTEDDLLRFAKNELDAEQDGVLDAHVETCSACQAALARLDPGPSAVARVARAHFPRSTGPDPDSAAPPAPSIPGYELLGVLGRGGMGVVYRARQLNLNRVVALKRILSGAQASEEQRARFLREAELVARLQHPNVGPVLRPTCTATGSATTGAITTPDRP
jgi:eukaryotic-like serine/threonine-protein kinase